MTAEKNLTDIRKATGKVYQILTETMEKYMSLRSLIYWDGLIKDLKNAGTEAYRANNNFPSNFFADMADPLLRWFWDRFENIRETDVMPAFKTLWQYHRKYLGQVQTDEMWTNAIKDGDEILKDADPHLKGFVMAILRDLEKRNPREEESATNEQATEKSAGETV